MLIRYGYEITLTCQQPTAPVCLLSVHVPISTYRDLFGNRCGRLVALAGDLTMWGDATTGMTDSWTG